MKVAIEGCCHGQLDPIYAQIQKLEARNNYKVDVLFICGDFQAIRNHLDLNCMAVPDKYKELGQFHKYYTGEKVAPILTIVIGGNHEASNYFWELYHGGWIAPKIYFLGFAGCVQVNGVRVAGASGIFKGNDFRLGHHEKLPYDASSLRSIYHIREFDVRRLSLLTSPQVFLSHDWPRSIEQHGNVGELLSRKRFLTNDVNSGNLGSPPLMGLLTNLKPLWWFSAHLHARFEATVVHHTSESQPGPLAQTTNPDEIVIDDDEDDNPEGKEPKSDVPNPPEPPVSSRGLNPEEIVLDDEEELVETPRLPLPPPRQTHFLALDKCLPGRQYLEVVDIPVPNERSASSTEGPTEPLLAFDPEWLAISRAFHPWLSITRFQKPFPPEEEARKMVAKEMEWLKTNLDITPDGPPPPILECQTFVATAPGPTDQLKGKRQPSWYTNPQTEQFCNMLKLENKINPPPPTTPA